MALRLLLALSLLLPSITAEIVYARTNRLDQPEYDQWNKTCGMQSAGKQTPFKVMVYVTKERGGTQLIQNCVGVIINKRFVITRATCYYNRTLNDYSDDSDMRYATKPQHTKIVVCADDGVNCTRGSGFKEVGVKNILYPQLIHYSQEYETVADVAILELDEELPEDRAICTPAEEEMFRRHKIFLISEEITDRPYYEGKFVYENERICGDATICLETYTFKPTTAMTTKPSSGLFFVRKNNRNYLLGMLKYTKDSPKILFIFPYFHDFVCTNTGDCGAAYDEYMSTRETRVLVNGLPLPQVSHCDVSFYSCKYDPLFFRFLPLKEMEYLENHCGESLLPKDGAPKNKWHEYPYTAAITVKGKGRVCSGAFISQVHVVTVAHCIFDVDEFLNLRNKEAGRYIDPTDLEVHYGSECYADGNEQPPLDKCKDPEMAKSIKKSPVRSVIVEGLRNGSDEWRYKYQLVLLELEQPTSKEIVIPICPYPGRMQRHTGFHINSVDSFEFTAAGNPDAENSFVTAMGKNIEPTVCDEFRAVDSNRVKDYNCRDDNVDMKLFGENAASSFTKSSPAFLGSQLAMYNGTSKRRTLYGLAHYFSPHKEDNVLGSFFPIYEHHRFICWFTGVCYFGRPDRSENKFFRIYTPEYRLTRAVIEQPVQRAGKNSLSNYELVMLEENNMQW